MKIIERKPSAKNDDFLATIARSIGSTLGTVAAKVNGSTRAPHHRSAGRTRTRKRAFVSRTRRRTSASVLKRSTKAAGLARRNRKKSAK
jgi:hypothetical protein